jgi:hypothetical protein
VGKTVNSAKFTAPEQTVWKTEVEEQIKSLAIAGQMIDLRVWLFPPVSGTLEQAVAAPRGEIGER